MPTTTNETRAYSAKSRPASTTNAQEPTTAAVRGASPRRDDRRGWRPVRIGEIIERAIAVIGMEARHG